MQIARNIPLGDFPTQGDSTSTSIVYRLVPSGKPATSRVFVSLEYKAPADVYASKDMSSGIPTILIYLYAKRIKGKIQLYCLCVV